MGTRALYRSHTEDFADLLLRRGFSVCGLLVRNYCAPNLDLSRCVALSKCRAVVVSVVRKKCLDVTFSNGIILEQAGNF